MSMKIDYPNFISPVNHPESYLSGSTIKSMIDRAAELELPYFAATDHGYFTSIISGYTYAKKKNIKFIAGVELFFKDKNCEIIKGTESQDIKYFKVVVHAKDQAAYQNLVKMSSDPMRDKVQVADNYYPLFNWKDLENISKTNVTVCSSNVEDMVTKHLLVNRADLGLKYYKKLLELFDTRYYPTIVPYKHDKYWSAIAEITLGESNHKAHIPLTDRIEFEEFKDNKDPAKSRWARVNTISTPMKLIRFNKTKKRITHVFMDKVRHDVKPEFQDVNEIKVINNFQDLPTGDIQAKANNFIIKITEKFGHLNNLLINSYSYYANEGDKVVQDMKLGEESRIYHAQYMAATEDVVDYLKESLGLSDEDVVTLVNNSYQWAEQFEDFELKYDYRLPIPEGEPQKLLVEQIKKVGRMKWDDERYVTQFREEFELLTQNGVIDLIPYFLPIIDVYDFYNEKGYLTGPARGSAGGFLISYLIGITHIDPIKYGLYSSRFLTMDRVKGGNLPDIDCDLESRVPLVGKDGNSGYLFNKYGNKAAQVSTRTLLRLKSAILDANRFVNGGKLEESVQKLSKSLPMPQGNDYEFVFGYEKDGTHVPGLLEQSEDLQKYAESRPEEWNIVKRALSIARQNSRHACAFIVSDAPIEDTVPIMEVGGVKRVTQPVYQDCEWAGLIKYDFLVVSALRDINLAIKYINKKNGDTGLKTGYFNHNDKPTYIWDLEEDPKVFDMLSKGKTETIFQLHSATATPLVKDIRPENVVDCAVITSLGRPGPLDFKDEKTGRNMAEEYAWRKRGASKSDIPILQEMLPETYGVLVFQEQITKLAKELAGMGVEDSENVRIAVGKKKQKLIESLKPVFIEGAAKKCGEETATRIWDMMETFARYGFNKSHAVAYSVISYACAYLKYYYPLEWWSAVLSNADDKEINEEFYKYVKDMVMPPDVNKSTEEITIDYDKGKILQKLSIISGFGESAAGKIIAMRPYKDIEDFVRKKPCGPAMTRKLIHVGVLDSLFDRDDTLLQKITKYEKAVVEVAHQMKVEEKTAELEILEDKKLENAKKRLEKYIDKGPAQPKIDPFYLTLTPKMDYLTKKSIYPTMNLNLETFLDSKTNTNIFTHRGHRTIMNKYGRETRLVRAETLETIDKAILDNNAYFVVPGYVMEAKEHTFGGGKKMLKLVIDSSGYISEKVIWPDYDSGQLIYPEELKKGAIAYFFYSKREGYPNTKIFDVIVEENSIIS